MLGSYCFDRILEGQDIVCCFQGISKSEIDLVLSQCDFMVADLNFEAHFIESAH
jgi:hypothetical protein